MISGLEDFKMRDRNSPRSNKTKKRFLLASVISTLLYFISFPVVHDKVDYNTSMVHDDMNLLAASKKKQKGKDITFTQELYDINDLIPIDKPMSIHEFLPKIMEKVTNKKQGRLIDFGAGVRDDDPMFPFMDAGWEGLLVDGDPNQKENLQKRFPTDKAHIDISYILADTIPTLLEKHDFANDVDMLKIDIDSFDCYVMHVVLEHIQPKVIIMEVNVKLPPHVRMAMFPGYERSHNEDVLTQISFDSEQRQHIYGCSLAYQVEDLMKPNGYDLVLLDWNNAIYINSNMFTGINESDDAGKEMYNMGYWSRNERDRIFSFNKETIPWRNYTIEQIFEELQALFVSKSSHRNHHLYYQAVGGGSTFEHACFHSITGILEKKEKSTNCSLEGNHKKYLNYFH